MQRLSTRRIVSSCKLIQLSQSTIKTGIKDTNELPLPSTHRFSSSLTVATEKAHISNLEMTLEVSLPQSHVSSNKWLKEPISDEYTCGRAVLLFESRYPESLKGWRKIFREEEPVLTETIKEMMDEFSKVPFLLTRQDDFDRCFRAVIEYSIQGNEKWSNFVVFCIEKIRGDLLTAEDLKLARVMSGLITISSLSLAMVDDIIDHGNVRYGRPCWHRLVKTRATVDVAALGVANSAIADRFFTGKPYHAAIRRALEETHLQFMLGEWKDLDLERRLEKTEDDTGIQWQHYTMENYLKILSYKSIAYFDLIVSSALIISGIHDPAVLAKAREITVIVGEIVQITNDWFDWSQWDHTNIHGNRSLGSDSRNGKLSWCVAVAWESADEEQRKLLRKYYGKDDTEAVDKVIRLYRELKVPEKHHLFDKNAYERACKLIDEWDEDATGVPRDIFPAAFACLAVYYNDDRTSFADSK